MDSLICHDFGFFVQDSALKYNLLKNYFSLTNIYIYICGHLLVSNLWNGISLLLVPIGELNNYE